VVDLKSPPMGFMSWERFRCTTDCENHPNDCINEELFRSTAEALLDQGLAAVGYTQVSIDDCWSAGRDPVTHRLVPDPRRFPSGMKALGNFLHDRNLTFGIYTDAGSKTCGGYAGSMGYQELDAQTFADWGVDFVKVDGCYIYNNTTHHTIHADYEAAFTAMGRAFHKASRKMVMSCDWPCYTGRNESAKPFETMYHEAGCNTWRNFADIDNRWNNVHHTIRHWATHWKALQAIPDGSFNSADMLVVGDDRYSPVPGQTILTIDQARLQLTFWALITSPLFIGADVRNINPAYRDILLNKHVIAINQDESRKQASCLVGCHPRPHNATADDFQVWGKPMKGGHSHAVAFFNVGSNTVASSIQVDLPLDGIVARCVDLWSNDPEEDVCNSGQGGTTSDWDIRPVRPGVLRIRALQVATTSQRLVRVDYYCDQEGDHQVALC